MKFKLDDYPPFKAGAGEYSYEDSDGQAIGIWEWNHNGTHYYEITNYHDNDIIVKNPKTELPDLAKERNRGQIARILKQYFNLDKKQAREIIDDFYSQLCYTPQTTWGEDHKGKMSEEAWEIARDPYLLTQIKELLDQEIVGEDVNKLSCWITAASSKYLALWIYLSGESRGGKDTIMDGVSILLPPEKVIHAFRFSSHAIEYLDEEGTGITDLDGRTIIIPEGEFSKEAMEIIRGMYGKKGQTYPIHLVKDQKRNTIYVKGCPVIITGGTAPIFEDQTMNRFQIQSIDATVDQTRAIHNIQKDMAAYPQVKTNNPELLLQEIVRNYQDLEVVIPYAHLLEFPTDLVRFRDDFKRFLYLIKMIAYIHQHSRQTYEVDGKKYITATFGDLYLAVRFIDEQFSSQIYNLDEAIYKFYLDLSDEYGETGFYVADAQKSSGKAPQTIRNYMQLLQERGIVEVTKDGNKNVYNLIIIEKKFKYLTFNNLVKCLTQYTEAEHNNYLNNNQPNNLNFAEGERKPVLLSPLTTNSMYNSITPHSTNQRKSEELDKEKRETKAQYLNKIVIPINYSEVFENIYDPLCYISLQKHRLLSYFQSGVDTNPDSGSEIEYLTWLDKVIESVGVPLNKEELPKEKKPNKKEPELGNDNPLPPASYEELSQLYPDSPDLSYHNRMQRWMERNRPWEDNGKKFGDLLSESESWELTLEQREGLKELYQELLDKAQIYFEICGLVDSRES